MGAVSDTINKAVRRCDLRVIRRFLEVEGVDVNCRDDEGNTPLISAAFPVTSTEEWIPRGCKHEHLGSGIHAHSPSLVNTHVMIPLLLSSFHLFIMSLTVNLSTLTIRTWSPAKSITPGTMKCAICKVCHKIHRNPQHDRVEQQ